MKNKISRAFFALMLVVCNGAIFAQVPSGYYNNGNDVKVQKVVVR